MQGIIIYLFRFFLNYSRNNSLLSNYHFAKLSTFFFSFKKITTTAPNKTFSSTSSSSSSKGATKEIKSTGKSNGTKQKSNSGETVADGTSISHAFQIYNFEEKECLSSFIPNNFNIKDKIQCIQDMSLSAWNPPPIKETLNGDLLYLRIITLENEVLHVTGSIVGFFVNSSTDTVFDPKPSKIKKEGRTLPLLLQQVSPSFKSAFDTLSKQLVQLSNLQILPSNRTVYPWLAKPIPHVPDSSRSLSSFFHATDLIENLDDTDWNEMIQSVRELPTSTPQERILRDQAMFKVHKDFIDAAIKGAQAIVDRSCLPLNQDAEEGNAHMYVVSGIKILFFSFLSPSFFFTCFESVLKKENE